MIEDQRYLQFPALMCVGNYEKWTSGLCSIVALFYVIKFWNFNQLSERREKTIVICANVTRASERKHNRAATLTPQGPNLGLPGGKQSWERSELRTARCVCMLPERIWVHFQHISEFLLGHFLTKKFWNCEIFTHKIRGRVFLQATCKARHINTLIYT